MPISLWQRISYRTDLLNCQFNPSCSNYAAQSILYHGILKGTFLATDRILRCHPEAIYYHIKDRGSFDSNGALLDPVVYQDNHRDKSLSPLVSAGMAAVLPGSGRVRSGRLTEGIIGGSIVLALGKVALSSYQENSDLAPLAGFLFLSFYGGDILGSYNLEKNKKREEFK